MWRIAGTLLILATVTVAGCARPPTPAPQAEAGSMKTGIAAEPPPASGEIPAAAGAGDGAAAYAAYRRAKTDGERRKRICIAANKDFRRAQTEVAKLHWPSPWEPHSPFVQDGFRYCVWSVIAARDEPFEDLGKRLKTFFPDMETWRVRELALAWRPDPAKCEDMRDSAYYRIPGAAEAFPRPLNVMAAAQAGDGWAAYVAYRQATTDAERRKWVCIAAHRGRVEAQAEIARLHSRSADDPPGPFERDLYKAYIWSIIAAHGNLSVEEVERRLGWMVEEGRWRAAALAVSWRPDPGLCEDLKESAYFNIP